MLVVAGGIIGARGLYVIENYGSSPSIDSVGDIFRLTEGGISIYGAILGGAVAGWAYGLWKHLPSAAGADAAVFGMLLGLAIGRIGDIINGEHFARASDLPWAFAYTNPQSTAFARAPMHPAVAYEMIGDLVILGVLWWLWRRHSSKSGVIFSLAFVLYGIMRFGVSFFRLHNGEVGAEHAAPFGLDLSVPQFISLFAVPFFALLTVYFLRRQEPARGTYVAPKRQTISRAERRRRMRAGTSQ
jgi:phosphatidylglycerol:prolipoprotein diacylglycerol transferase